MAQKEEKIYSNMSPDSKTGLRTSGNRGCDFKIHVRGHLSDVSADWFEGLTIERLDVGEIAMKAENNQEIPALPQEHVQDQPSTGSTAKFYEIHVKGHLDNTWSKWLDGLEVKLLENGETILFGPIVDQSALMGVLNKLDRLNLTLLSLNDVNKYKNHNERK
jgi:hypothetical protein